MRVEVRDGDRVELCACDALNVCVREAVAVCVGDRDSVAVCVFVMLGVVDDEPVPVSVMLAVRV